ncbi:MAG: DUF4446 family protein [Chloroflexi bacterium]|nr:DUF4446 family protein [Chloroflexota bacterium]
MDVALLVWAIALTILLIVGIVWVLDLQARLRQLKSRHDELFSDETRDDVNMTVALGRLASRLAETNARTERLVARTDQIDATLVHTVQGVGLVRFRAFQDTGGDQSFALALTDGQGNGTVISALFGRGVTRVYAKPVQAWLSDKPLGEEEKQALAEARQSVVDGN